MKVTLKNVSKHPVGGFEVGGRPFLVLPGQSRKVNLVDSEVERYEALQERAKQFDDPNNRELEVTRGDSGEATPSEFEAVNQFGQPTEFPAHEGTEPPRDGTPPKSASPRERLQRTR